MPTRPALRTPATCSRAGSRCRALYLRLARSMALVVGPPPRRVGQEVHGRLQHDRPGVQRRGRVAGVGGDSRQPRRRAGQRLPARRGVHLEHPAACPGTRASSTRLANGSEASSSCCSITHLAYVGKLLLIGDKRQVQPCDRELSSPLRRGLLSYAPGGPPGCYQPLVDANRHPESCAEAPVEVEADHDRILRWGLRGVLGPERDDM